MTGGGKFNGLASKRAGPKTIEGALLTAARLQGCIDNNPAWNAYPASLQKSIFPAPSRPIADDLVDRLLAGLGFRLFGNPCVDRVEQVIMHTQFNLDP